jgi:hypothetical protein
MLVQKPPLPVDPARLFVLAAGAALARVIVAESADELAVRGFVSLAASTASVRFLCGFAVAFAALFVLRRWHRARPHAWSPAVACAGLTYAFVTLELPAMPLQTPGFDGP